MAIPKKVELLEEHVLFRGKRLLLAKRVYELDGAKFVAEVVKFGQAAAIVPIKDDGKVIMIRQFRSSLNKWILEVPAGKVDPGESPEEAARRELIEEVGYKAGELEKLASIYMSPGYSDEILHIFLAKNLIHVGRNPDPDELIEMVDVKLEDAINMVLSEDAADSKTLSALFLANERLKGACSV
ncbi:MAG: NUDIX hydrolase [Candidatus Bathyarchaeota archaeon]|nr:NUDIX hydrolase [Candidatus Bathyarchaeota archaeon]MCX8176963.1 NUDIX hydrolase [Candidatus Bathyarchaeota archaeon]MDW8193350.1 NUDIX hydrolase [Nitrososphaerota archaeon]